MQSRVCNRKLRDAFVLVLVAFVLLFSIYIKVLPDITQLSAHSNPKQFKVWLDPDHQDITKLNLATSAWLLSLIMIVALAERKPRSRASAPFAAKGKKSHDIFAESRNWFRPPPSL